MPRCAGYSAVAGVYCVCFGDPSGHFVQNAPLHGVLAICQAGVARPENRVIQTPAPLVYLRISSLERRDVTWFPNDPNAAKNAALEGTISVELATRQRKAQADGGMGDTDRACRCR